jgi:signal transduction histidine kinase
MTAFPVELALIPIERELQERVTWFIRLRWLAGAGILLGAWAAIFLVGVQLPLWPMVVIGLTVLCYNVFFEFYRRRIAAEPETLKRFIFVQIGVDWLALVFLVHYSGGIRSPVSLVFAFHLIIGAILLSPRACYVLAAAASLLLGTGTLFESQGLLPLPPVQASLALPPVLASLTGFHYWIILSGFFLVTTFLATSITARLREKEEALYSSERALDSAYQEMQALYQIGQVVNSTLDTKEVLELIAEHAARLLDQKACFIRIFDESGTRLYIGGAYGLSEEYVNKGPVEVSKSLIDLEAVAGGVVQVLEVAEDLRFQYREEARREGLRSVLCVPVSGKSGVLGVIRVYSAQPHEFSEQEQHLLLNLANLGAVAIENSRAYAELQSLNRERTWFARMTHHQLRAPLAAIQGVLDALPYAGPLNEKQEDLISRSRRRITDAFDMIRDLLDLAAAQRPLEDEAKEHVLLKDALLRAVETARERAESKGVSFSNELPKEELTLLGYAADIDRIFSNLLDNAVKYTPPGGSVKLQVSRVKGDVRFEISDTGIGIEEDQQERVFEGFYRTQAAKATGEIGTGLGLSIVKRLVERWGGSIDLQSGQGKGTTFTIILPIHESVPESE